MATQRYVSTSFWQDPWVLDELSSDERYTYLYLLTAPGSNIAGVYELSIKTAEMHTGYDRDQLIKIFKRFEEAGKAYYFDRYVIIPTWPKHQRYDERQSIKNGITKVLKNLPESVWQKVCSVDYQFPLSEVDRPLDTLSTPSTPQEGVESPPRAPQEPPYSDTDTDTDTDYKRAATPDADASTEAGVVPAQPKPQKVQGGDSELYAWLKARFEREQPNQRFTDYGKEGKAIKGIIRKARERDPTDPHRFAEGMVESFAELRRRDRKFFGKQPFLPSALNASGIWDRVLSEAYQRYQREQDVAVDWEEPPF